MLSVSCHTIYEAMLTEIAAQDRRDIKVLYDQLAEPLGSRICVHVDEKLLKSFDLGIICLWDG